MQQAPAQYLEDRHEYVAAETTALTRRWAPRAARLGAIVFCALAVVDFVATPDNFSHFLVLRLVSSCGLLVLASFATRARTAKQLHCYALFMLIGSAIAIEWMVMRFGGHTSPYFVGLIILAGFGQLVFPASFRSHLIATVSILLIYLLPIILFDTITQPRVFATQSILFAGCLSVFVAGSFLGSRAWSARFSLQWRLETNRRALLKSVQSGSQRLSATTEELLKEIQARQELATTLERAKNEWEQTFDAISEAITVHDKDFNIIRANKAAMVLLNSRFEDVLHGKCFASYHGGDCPPQGCPSCRTTIGGETVQQDLYEPHLGKHLRLRTFPRRTADGSLIGSVHIATDITSEIRAKEQEERLRHELHVSQKLDSIGNLAGGIAHDFNNVLTVILANAEAGQAQVQKGSQFEPIFADISEAANRASALIQQLLAFGRKQELARRPLDLGDVVSGLAKMLHRLIGEDVELSIEVEDALPAVNADESQVEQLLMNLVVNARDAMPQGGRIVVSLTRGQRQDGAPPASVVLSVTDTGCGMTPEVKERLFEPFFSTKDAGRGAGLGLSTVHGIVTQHGGSITLESEPGKGTTFRIALPVTESEAKATEPKAPRSLPRGNELLWLVDDDPGVLGVLERTLDGLGYQLLTATSGPDLLSKTANVVHPPDLLITDVVMPEMNGRKLAERLTERFPKLNVLFISGYTQDILDGHGLGEGASLLNKPLTPRSIAHGVRTMLDGAIHEG